MKTVIESQNTSLSSGRQADVTLLSIIIPVYNEEKTLSGILTAIVNVPFPEKIKYELVVVNDCSKDRSEEIVYQFARMHPDVIVKYVRHEKNQGKGSAIRTGLSLTEGDYIVIQDADLEYNPDDFLKMLPLLLSGQHQVVYGSRFLNSANRHSYQSFYLGGRLVSLMTNILYNQHLTDEPTCYKMFAAGLIKSIPLKCTGFEFCPEVTAKVSKLGHQIPEIPICYYPRSIQEGKKISWRDGIEAIWILFKYRFTD